MVCAGPRRFTLIVLAKDEGERASKESLLIGAAAQLMRMSGGPSWLQELARLWLDVLTHSHVLQLGFWS